MELFKFNEKGTMVFLRPMKEENEPSVISITIEADHLEQMRNFAKCNKGVLLTYQIDAPDAEYVTSFNYAAGHVFMCCRYYFESRAEWEIWHAKYGDSYYLNGAEELTIR